MCSYWLRTWRPIKKTPYVIFYCLAVKIILCMLILCATAVRCTYKSNSFALKETYEYNTVLKDFKISTCRVYKKRNPGFEYKFKRTMYCHVVYCLKALLSSFQTMANLFNLRNLCKKFSF